MRALHLVVLTPLLVGQAGGSVSPEASSALRPARSLAFDAARAESCLAEARAVMVAHDDAFRKMERFYTSEQDYEKLREHVACERTYPASVALRRGIPPEVFLKFEGGWRGSWAGIEARHLWMSIAWNLQLVIVEDGGQLQRAINYVDGRGSICGIVRQADGRERPHEGVWQPATADEEEALVWLTPERTYRERAAVTEDGERHYRIDEEIPGPGESRRGVRATYQTWKTQLDMSDYERARATLIGGGP